MIYPLTSETDLQGNPNRARLQLNFMNLYIAAQDPRVQAIMAMPQGISRVAAAIKLALATGLIIDGPIVADGADPLLTMSERTATGVMGVPCVGMPLLPAEFKTAPLPVDAVPTTLDDADFPEFEIPGQPQPNPGELWVDTTRYMGGGYYEPTATAAAVQKTANPIQQGQTHDEYAPDGTLKRYVACYPDSRRANWLKWLDMAIGSTSS